MLARDLKDLIRADLETALANAGQLDAADDASDYSQDWRDRVVQHIDEALDLV